MKVAFVGAGAIGSILGAFLAKGGADVILIDPFKEHMDKIAADGLIIHYPDGKQETVLMKTAYNADNVGPVDIAIIMTKTNYTDAAVQEVKKIMGPKTVVGTFQNGLGNPEKVAEYIPKEKVFYGCLNVSSRILAPGEVLGNVFGEHNIYAGSVVFNEEQKIANEYLKATFANSDVSYKYGEEIDTYVWTKGLLNISGNAAQGLVRLKPAVTADDENYKKLIASVVREVCEVAKAKGVKNLDGEKFLASLANVGKSDLAHHWGSTAQDMLFMKRKTEVETLNGAIVKFGKELGIATPVNETIYLLVRTIEEHYQEQYQENQAQ